MAATNKHSKDVYLMGKSYKINIDPADEKMYDSAANLVNNRFALFASKFAKSPVVEQMSMLALDLTIRYLQLRDVKDDTVLADKVSELIEKMETALKDN